MGLPMTVKSSDIAEVVRENVQSITKQVAEKIIELNGDKSVSAVFVVGGGGKITGFTECLAEYLGVAKERVALRGSEVLREVSAPGFRDRFSAGYTDRYMYELL